MKCHFDPFLFVNHSQIPWDFDVTTTLRACGLNFKLSATENVNFTLIPVYLNDLQEFLSKAYNGLSMACNLVQDFVQDEDTIVYLKLFALLYMQMTQLYLQNQNMTFKQPLVVCTTTVTFGNYS